jgi:lysozyme family protein
MSPAFDRAFAETIGHEGGFQDSPLDRGNWTGGRRGEGDLRGTKYGISAMSYPDLDIAGLTLADAKAIYQRDYWDRVSGDDLPDGVALFVFDYAVNSGVARAAMALQRIVGVADDGVIGPITLAAVNRWPARNLIGALYSERGRFYRDLSTFPVFGKGWTKRNRAVQQAALVLHPDPHAAAPKIHM